MADFAILGVADGLEVALAAASHLEAKHAATVAAARALARKIDAWDVIVQWAREDVADSSARPAVPQNDNTSLGTYARYLEQLGLVVPVAKGAAPSKSTPESAHTPASDDSPDAKIVQMQQRAAQRRAL